MENNLKFLDPRTLAKLEGLELRARSIVEGYVSGVHRSPYHGFSIEFAEHREYSPGDDLRYVDWKVFGKTDKVYLKQYEEETNLVSYMLLDTSESMRYRSADAALSKLEYAQCVAASLSYLILQQQDSVGLVTFDDQVRALIRASSNPSHLKQLLYVMENCETAHKTQTGPIFHDLAERLKRRGLVLILSDLFDNVEAMLAGLKHFRHRRHEVVVFHVLDPAELDFPFRHSTLFRGLEQLPDVLADPRSLRRAYLDEFGKFLQSVRKGCRTQRVDYVLLRTDQSLDVALSSYLASRTNRLSQWPMLAHSAILAFGFGNLLMLGWLAAAGAPVLIHLWNKRRYREVHWAAIEFLLAAMRKNSRRMRLEQWLLLLVRTLLVACIVLALAQPFLERAGLHFTPGQRTLKVFVIDGSYSMGYKPTDKSRFDHAKQWATQVVEESSQGDGFALVLMASPPTVIVGSPAVEARDFIEEIDNLKLPHGGGDLPATLVQVEQILDRAERSGLSRKEVYFLTDLGRNSWMPDLKQNQADEFQQRASQLAQQASLVVVDLGQGGSENMALTSVAINEPFVTTARGVTITAQVRNFGTQPRTRQLAELHVDGRRVKDTFVDVPAGEQAPLSFSHRFETPGDHVVEARLGPDLLDIDNQRWLSVPVKEHLRVLCVNGKPAATAMSGATDYLALALNPDSGDESVPSIVQAEVIPESSLLERDLSRYDCVFLCNVAQFTPSEARALENVLQAGGGLVFFLGDQVLADRYNRELTPERGVNVLPAQLKELVSEAQYRFDPLGYRHPLMSVFQGREQSGLLTTPVYKYYRLVPQPSARLALAFDGGDPAIVEMTSGRGRSILVATEGSLSSVDAATHNPWTTMPAWPSFVPLVQEILALAVRGQMAEHNVEVGQPLGDSIEALASRPLVKVTTPGGASEEVRMSLDAHLSRWSFADTLQSGVYRVELGAPVARDEAFAVNVDTAEGDLARLAPEELPKGFANQARTNLEETDSAGILRPSGLHKNLLYCVLGLLFVEAFLAWRFGNATP